MQDETNRSKTENGAAAFKSTKSKVLDYFSVGSAIRYLPEDEQVQVFREAFAEDPNLALKAMFYSRDIRGGQGQREAFRAQLKDLIFTHPDLVRMLIPYIPEYGRWDDLYELFDTPLEDSLLHFIQITFDVDVESDTPSLMGKWLPSENSSSKKSAARAKKIRRYMKMKAPEFRRALTELRNKIGIVERDMSRQQWTDINYSHVPSQAMMLYRNAFKKHDPTGFEEFISNVNKGDVTINAGTLYPYQIVEKIGGFNYYNIRSSTFDKQTANALWNALPDYIGDDASNALAVVDTSGSMSGDPINVAISLGLYLAERNNGLFKDHVVTFSSDPELFNVAGNDITTKIRQLADAPWGMSTNLQAVFDLILKSAVKGNVPPDEMPTKLFIISDMQFNCVRGGEDKTLYEYARQEYAQHGYELPQIVFWNVRGRIGSSPATKDDNGVQLISGCSPSIFEFALTGDFKTPYEFMIEVLTSKRYEQIKME